MGSMALPLEEGNNDQTALSSGIVEEPLCNDARPLRNSYALSSLVTADEHPNSHEIPVVTDGSGALPYPVSATAEAMNEAVIQGQHDRMRSLIHANHDLDLTIRNDEGHPPLNEAAHRGDYEACRILLDGGAGPESSCGKAACKHARPLHLAAMLDSVPILDALVAKRVDIASLSDLGQCALHWAAQKNSSQAIEYLMSRGLQLSVVDFRGQNAIHYAVKSRSADALKCLLGQSLPPQRDLYDRTNQSPLDLAIIDGWKDGVQILRDAGVSIGLSSRTSRTPLHLAAQKGTLEVFRLLLAMGADINSSDDLFRQPLHEAAVSTIDTAVKIRSLVHHGADLEAKCVLSPSEPGLRDTTPLLYAARHGHLDAIECLIWENASKTAVNSIGSLVQNSLYNVDVNVLKYLLLSDTKLRSDEATDSIRYLIRRFRQPGLATSTEHLEFLLSAGARIHDLNHAQQSLLHSAASADWYDLVQIAVYQADHARALENLRSVYWSLQQTDVEVEGASTQWFKAVGPFLNRVDTDFSSFVYYCRDIAVQATQLHLNGQSDMTPQLTLTLFEFPHLDQHDVNMRPTQHPNRSRIIRLIEERVDRELRHKRRLLELLQACKVVLIETPKWLGVVILWMGLGLWVFFMAIVALFVGTWMYIVTMLRGSTELRQ